MEQVVGSYEQFIQIRSRAFEQAMELHKMNGEWRVDEVIKTAEKILKFVLQPELLRANQAKVG